MQLPVTRSTPKSIACNPMSHLTHNICFHITRACYFWFRNMLKCTCPCQKGQKKIQLHVHLSVPTNPLAHGCFIPTAVLVYTHRCVGYLAELKDPAYLNLALKRAQSTCYTATLLTYANKAWWNCFVKNQNPRITFRYLSSICIVLDTSQT